MQLWITGWIPAVLCVAASLPMGVPLGLVFLGGCEAQVRWWEALSPVPCTLSSFKGSSTAQLAGHQSLVSWVSFSPESASLGMEQACER